jgi:hypothetical protein
MVEQVKLHSELNVDHGGHGRVTDYMPAMRV